MTEDTLMTNPGAEVAEDPRFVRVDAIEAYVTTDAAKKVFSYGDESALYEYLNAGALDDVIAKYEATVRAGAYQALYKPAEEARVIDRGPHKGGVKAAVEEKVPTQRAIDAHVTRKTSAAREFLAWYLEQE